MEKISKIRRRFMTVLMSLALIFTCMPLAGVAEKAEAAGEIVFHHEGGYELTLEEASSLWFPPNPVAGDHITVGSKVYTYSFGSGSTSTFLDENNSPDPYEEFSPQWISGRPNFEEGGEYYFRWRLTNWQTGNYEYSDPVLIKIKSAAVDPTIEGVSFTPLDEDYRMKVGETSTPPDPVDGDILTLMYSDESTVDYTYDSAETDFLDGEGTALSDVIEWSLGWSEDQTFDEGDTPTFIYTLDDNAGGVYTSAPVAVTIYDDPPAPREVTLEYTRASDPAPIDRRYTYTEFGIVYIPEFQAGDTLKATVDGDEYLFEFDGMDFLNGNRPMADVLGFDLLMSHREWDRESFTQDTGYYRYFTTVDGVRVTTNSLPIELLDIKTATDIEFKPVTEAYIMTVSEARDADEPPVPKFGDVITLTYDDESSEDFTFGSGALGPDFYNEAGKSIYSATLYDLTCGWDPEGQTFNEGDEPTFAYKLGTLKSNLTPVTIIADTPVVPQSLWFGHETEYELKEDETAALPEAALGDSLTIVYSDYSSDIYDYSPLAPVFVSRITSHAIESDDMYTYDKELSVSWDPDQEFKAGNICYFRYKLTYKYKYPTPGSGESGEVVSQRIPVKILRSDKPEPKPEPPVPVNENKGIQPGATMAAVDSFLTKRASDSDVKGSKIAPLKLVSRKQTKNSVKLNWTKVTGAAKYVLYGNKCGKKNKLKKLRLLKGKTLNVKKVKGVKVKKGTYYKFMVVAFNAKNKVVATSKVVHAATKGGKVGNTKKVNAQIKKGKKWKSVSKVTVKKGYKVKVKAKTVPVSKKLKVQKHRKVLFDTSNKKIATVTAAGMIKGVKKGKCKVFLYAQNGIMKTLTVTVK